MLNFKAYIYLARPHQYYKNLLIFLGLIFSAKIFEFDLYPNVILGFFALSAISSISYIINDWKDIEVDKKHPEKKNRPLASGAVNELEAIFLIIALFIVIFLITLILNIPNQNKLLFIIVLFSIFLTSQMYSFYFKNKAFYDVTFISLNYVWRAVAGIVVIVVELSPWLFILGYIFAMFLALSKRKGDLHLLGVEKAREHKKVFEVYTEPILDQLIVLVSGIMILSYAIYVVESIIDFNNEKAQFSKFENPYIMLLTIPIVTLIIMKMIYFQISGSEKIRKAELLFLDQEILILGILTGFLTVLSLYWTTFKFNELIELIYR